MNSDFSGELTYQLQPHSHYTIHQVKSSISDDLYHPLHVHHSYTHRSNIYVPQMEFSRTVLRMISIALRRFYMEKSFKSFVTRINERMIVITLNPIH